MERLHQSPVAAALLYFCCRVALKDIEYYSIIYHTDDIPPPALQCELTYFSLSSSCWLLSSFFTAAGLPPNL